jgi:hypothetical protein
MNLNGAFMNKFKIMLLGFVLGLSLFPLFSSPGWSTEHHKTPSEQLLHAAKFCASREAQCSY